ncbi:MAG: D-2-hydroxyacid dehydrogenase [Oscillospiraceae bacterium]|nr:D-2-hydroxyacid dehydrogenase [Oscillospiraceae bacterium]
MTLLVVQTRLFNVSPSALLRLEQRFNGLSASIARADSLTPEQMASCEIILGTPPPELLRHAASLRWLHTTNAGAEPYNDLAIYPNPGIILTNASGVYGVPVAEHGLGLFLALSRQFPYYARQARAREWLRRDDVKEMCGATAAIFGLGDLGQNLARRVKAVGCKVIGVRRNILQMPPEADELYAPHQKLAVLARADYVASCVPQTPQTLRMFDAEAFEAMKPGAVFINLGRGSAVDHAALCAAVKSGRLFGAGLDVCDPEPLDADSELWDLENVLITAHSSAASEHTDRRGLELFCDLLERYRAGRRLYNVVDFFRGY